MHLISHKQQTKQIKTHKQNKTNKQAKTKHTNFSQTIPGATTHSAHSATFQLIW
jgi:hypothetical protein